MSTFGSPGGRTVLSKPIPPERGSFPLDHDGECKPIMGEYLKCLRAHRGVNDPECRRMSKAYLQCRMERNLMAPDEMKNLGFAEEQKELEVSGAGAGAGAASRPADAAVTMKKEALVAAKGVDDVKARGS